MPIRFLDRAKESTSTTGSGTLSLGGASAGFVAISGIGSGNSTYYTITEGNNFEVGLGTYNSVGNTLSRAEIFSTSNSDDSKINLGGDATVFITYPADKSIAKTSGNFVGIGMDPQYQLQVSGTGSFNTVRWADGTTQVTSAVADINIVSGLTVTNATNITATGAINAADILEVSGVAATNTTNITTNATNIATNVTNITATGGINAADILEVSGVAATNTTNIAATGQRNHDDIIYVSGVTDTNAANISTNTSNISTNASNITATGNINAADILDVSGVAATNTTNIATNATNITATGAINAADIIEVSGDVATNTSNISTNTSNIATNVTNIAATGATNAAAITVNTSNIAATGQRNHDDIIYVSGVTDTNAANISTNTSNISTNASNITATGNINAADILEVSGVTATNTTNITTNATNITATGAINAADILEVSGVAATNTTNITTNATNIATNTTNITATGDINAADILVVSGIAAGKDNYQYWTATDGSNNSNIATTDTVKYTGAGIVTVSLASGNPSVVTISGSGGGGGGGTPGGSDTYVQFNDGGSSFGGESEFTYAKAGSGILKVGTIVTSDADAARIGVVSIGSGAYTTNNYSVAIGRESVAGGTQTVAIGNQANATSYSVAIGNAARSTAQNSVAIGIFSKANSYRTVAIGDYSTIDEQYSVGIGYYTRSSDSYATAIGASAQAGDHSICLGPDSNANAANSIAIGYQQITPISGLLIGQGTNNWILSGNFNDAVGATNGNLVASTKFGINRTSAPDAMLDVTNFANTDVGVIVQGAASQTADLQQWQDSAGTTFASVMLNQSNDRAILVVSGTIVSSPIEAANRPGSVSIGSGAYTTYNGSVSIGSNAYGAGVSIGASAYATNYNSVVVGNAATSTGADSVAIGRSASAGSSNRSIAIGFTTAGGFEGVALGNSASCGNYGVALGSRGTANGGICVGQNSQSYGGSIMMGMDTRANSNEQGLGFGQGVHIRGKGGIAMGAYSEAYASGIALGWGQTAQTNEFIVGNAGRNSARTSILSGQFNGSDYAANSGVVGFLTVLDDRFRVDGSGQVRVNDQYTFPTGVTTSNDYILTAQTDGSTAWAAAGGSAAGSDTYVQFNDGGSSFGGESEFTYAKAGSGILKVGTIVTSDADAARIGVVSIGSGAYTTNNYSVAIGRESVAGGTQTVAIGNQANATSYSVAIGNAARSTAQNSVAIGIFSKANSYRTVAIGDYSTIDEQYSVGIGYYTRSSDSYATAIGASAQAGDHSICLGPDSNANAANSIAIGYQQITPISGLLIGQGTNNWILSGNFNDAVGATNGNLVASTKFGINRTSAPDAMLDVTNFANTDVGVIVQGAASQAADLQQWQDSAGTTLASIAPSLNTTDRMTMMVSGTIVSNPSDADRIGVVSIGSGAYATSNNAIIIGQGYGKGIVIGDSSSFCDNTASLCIGYGNTISNYDFLQNSVAIGYGNTISRNYCVAIGSHCTVNNGSAVAIGHTADALGSYAVAIGGGNPRVGSSNGISIGRDTECSSAVLGMAGISIGAYAKTVDRGIAIGCGTTEASAWRAYAEDHCIALGSYQYAYNSGLMVGMGQANHMFSGHFNSDYNTTNGNLDILNNSLSVDGSGQVRVNDQYTFPTGVTTVNDYVLTAQTDGSTAWAAGGGGGGISWDGSTANGIATYKNASEATVESNLTFDGSTLTVAGHLAATTKSFLIDHPTEPDKKLQYASLEGPENGVYVRGHTNDSIIDLPDYWTALVDQDSITVQITAKDAPQPYLYVSGVANNQVHLISDRSVSAYYTVNGTRKDVTPLQVEI